MRIRPFFPMYMKKLKRGPAVILPKDAGTIISHCGFNKKSKIVEIGGGSGFLTVQLARIVKKIIVYEKRKEFVDIINSNTDKLGLKNVKVKNKEVIDKINEKDMDGIVIDIPNAHEVIPHVYTNIKNDGCMSAHTLSVEQMKSAYLAMDPLFKKVMAVQINEIPFEINERRTRPAHTGILFSSYLVFGFGKIATEQTLTIKI